MRWICFCPRAPSQSPQRAPVNLLEGSRIFWTTRIAAHLQLGVRVYPFLRASTIMPSQQAITFIEILKSYVDEREGRRESGVGSCIIARLHT
jgi:hypothetical protein